MASAILVTTSQRLADEVVREIEGFLPGLERRAIIEKSLEQYGYILVAEDMEQAVEMVNEIASEHLEIVTANPFEVMGKVRHAGAIFLGESSSEPLGDYFAGPNHILPTAGTARFFSPLGVDDFIKKSSIIYYSRDALRDISGDIIRFAQAEGLTAHANSIAVRLRRRIMTKIQHERMTDMERIASVERRTKETQITVTLNLDGSGQTQIDTGIGFFDHMLDGLARHGLFDLTLHAEGDLQVDDHHTIEDTGIVLGTAIAQAAGDKKGIARTATGSSRWMRCWCCARWTCAAGRICRTKRRLCRG